MLDTGVKRDQASRLRQIAAGHFTVAPRPIPRVITITSGKGGVGKSILALNLSLMLCGLDRRVLLVDADTNLGNLDVLLGISPEFRLGDVLRGEKGFDDVLVSPFPGLRLLPGSSGDVGYPLVPAQTPSGFIAGLKSIEGPTDEIIIDTSAGLSPEVVGCAVNADEVLVVTTPEPTAVMDAYAMIKVLERTRHGIPIHVVMNAVRVPSEADDAAVKLSVATEQFLGRSFVYLGIIPYDEQVVTCVARHRAVVREFPTSRVSLSVKAIARHFLHQSE